MTGSWEKRRWEGAVNLQQHLLVNGCNNCRLVFVTVDWLYCGTCHYKNVSRSLNSSKTAQIFFLGLHSGDTQWPEALWFQVVHPSSPYECSISRTLWVNFFKFVTNVRFDDELIRFWSLNVKGQGHRDFTKQRSYLMELNRTLLNCESNFPEYLGVAVSTADGGFHGVTLGTALLLQRHHLLDELTLRQLEGHCRQKTQHTPVLMSVTSSVTVHSCVGCVIFKSNKTADVLFYIFFFRL